MAAWATDKSAGFDVTANNVGKICFEFNCGFGFLGLLRFSDFEGLGLFGSLILEGCFHVCVFEPALNVSRSTCEKCSSGRYTGTLQLILPALVPTFRTYLSPNERIFRSSNCCDVVCCHPIFSGTLVCVGFEEYTSDALSH
ncbi:unnamed protein product [Pylaiella littoralis]